MSKKIIAKNGRAIFSPADQTIYTVETSSGEIPEGYIKPEGTKKITSNGLHSVETYANVEVNVPNEIPSDYIKPSGTLTIDSNGTHNVREFESVEVNIESGGVVDGSLVFEGVTDDETEVILPIQKSYYRNAFVGNAEIIAE